MPGFFPSRHAALDAASSSIDSCNRVPVPIGLDSGFRRTGYFLLRHGARGD